MSRVDVSEITERCERQRKQIKCRARLDMKSVAVKKESSEGSGLLQSIDYNVTDAHTGYNVHREALNEAAVISGDQFHEPHALVVRL